MPIKYDFCSFFKRYFKAVKSISHNIQFIQIYTCDCEIYRIEILKAIRQFVSLMSDYCYFGVSFTNETIFGCLDGHIKCLTTNDGQYSSLIYLIINCNLQEATHVDIQLQYNYNNTIFSSIANCLNCVWF